MSDDKVIIYEATISACPFCGSAIQEVTGVDIGTKWVWSIRCTSCPGEMTGLSSEKELIKAWNRRYKKHEVEQDGDSTWDSCLDRIAAEIARRLSGTDRSDPGNGDAD